MAHCKNETGGGGRLLGARQPKLYRLKALEPEGPRERGSCPLARSSSSRNELDPPAPCALCSPPSHGGSGGRSPPCLHHTHTHTHPRSPQEAAVSSSGPGLASKWATQATSGSLVRKMRMKIPLTQRIVGGLHELSECEKSFPSCTAACSLDRE